MKLTSDDYIETNESPALLKDALEHANDSSPQEDSPSSFVKFFQNFWYYHKVKLFVGILIIAVSIVVIPDLIEKNRPSVLDICAVNCSISVNDIALAEELSQQFCNPDSKETLHFITDISFSLEQETDFDRDTLLALQVNIDSDKFDALIMDKATADYLYSFLVALPEEVPSYIPSDLANTFLPYEYKFEEQSFLPGFFITDLSFFQKYHLFEENKDYVLIPLNNAVHPENLTKFMQFILN